MVSWPLYFFCTECGTIHEITYRNLHPERWSEIMLFIAENDPSSRELAAKFGFHLRTAQKHLYKYKKMMENLAKVTVTEQEHCDAILGRKIREWYESRLSKGLRTG